MPVEMTKSQLLAMQRAEMLTREQLNLAQKLNQEYFDGEGLDNLPGILQALASNYHASVVWAQKG